MLGQLIKGFLNSSLNRWLKDSKWIGVILLLGFAVRFGYILTQDATIYWIDGVEYVDLAKKLASGEGYVLPDGSPTAFRPLGYPLFLAFLVKMGIHDLFGIRLIQVLISTCTIFLIYVITKQLFGYMPALFSAALAAFYPYFVFISGAVLPTCLFSFLFVLTTVLLINRSGAFRGLVNMISVGLFFGYLTLVRPSAGILVVVSTLWVFICHISDVKQALLKISILGICVLIVVLPWIYRNYEVMGKPALALNGGRNFWLGNNINATASSGNNVDLTKDLDDKQSLLTSEVEKDHLYCQEAVRFITLHPFKFIRLSCAKAINFWRLYPKPTSGYPSNERLSRIIGSLACAVFFFWGLIGLFFSSRSMKHTTLLFLMYFFAYTLLHAVFISKLRLRLPLDHIVSVYTGFGMAQTLKYLKLFIRQSSLNRIPGLKIWERVNPARV